MNGRGTCMPLLKVTMVCNNYKCKINYTWWSLQSTVSGWPWQLNFSACWSPRADLNILLLVKWHWQAQPGTAVWAMTWEALEDTKCMVSSCHNNNWNYCNWCMEGVQACHSPKALCFVATKNAGSTIPGDPSMVKWHWQAQPGTAVWATDAWKDYLVLFSRC